MASGTDEKVKYVCMVPQMWSGYELGGFPSGLFDGCADGSVGYMAVFDDVEKLKEAYPDAEIMKITRMKD